MIVTRCTQLYIYYVDECFFSQASTSSKKTKRGLAKKLLQGTVYEIIEVSGDGEPLEPKKTKQLFVQQCGVVARDRTPITVREWNNPKEAEWSDVYIDDRFKEQLFTNLMAHFKLPECDIDERRLK